MNTLKLLTLVKININTYICQALARYSSRSYCKGTGRVLKKVRVLVSHFFPVNTGLSSAFYAIRFESASEFQRVTPMKTRCRLDENPRKGRSWSGVSRVLLLLTALVFQYLYFSFKALKNIRAFILLALMFHMFSLSAQTPRRDSGAMSLTPLQIGDSIPNVIWNTPIPVINHPEGKETVTLADYKDKKIIILDFWASYCSPCIRSITKIDAFVQDEDLKGKTMLLPVLVHDAPERGERFLTDWNSSMWSVDDSNFRLKSFFSNYISGFGVVLISEGRFVAAPSAKDISYEKLKRQAFSEPVEWMNVSRKGVQR